MSTPDAAELARIQTKRDAARATVENFLTDIRERRGADAGLTIGEQEKLRQMTGDLRSLERRATEYESELARCGEIPPGLAKRAARSGPMGTAGQLAPLHFSPETLRDAHTRAKRGEAVSLETRDFTSGSSLLPATLFPQPTFPRHENRLLDRLPGYALDSPSLEYVQVNSITGAAGIVGEGQPKPEIDLPATKLICTALKLAVHAGISWENMLDYEAFTQAVHTELMKQVIDLENQQLWGGDPTAGGLNSLTKTAGILTFTATGGGGSNPEYFTDLAGAISTLRTGPALAEPDLCLMHPNTWANVRTAKDQYGRFLASVDPTANQAESIWGVDVLVSTQFTAGKAVLVDTSLVGRVAIRESLTLRIGYAASDFTSNIVRVVCEERLNFAVERPAAIVFVSGLPSAAPTEAPAKSTARK